MENVDVKLTEHFLVIGLKRLKEIEDLKAEAKKAFNTIECDAIEFTFYEPNTVHFLTGLQRLADRLGIETHTEDHGDCKDKKLVCKWKNLTFFQLGDETEKGYQFK